MYTSTSLVRLAAVIAAFICPSVAAVAGSPSASQESGMPHREKGQKIDLTVFASDDVYASFPIIIRTDREVVLAFDTQELQALRAAKGIHPHYQPVCVSKWAISRDGGLAWQITDQPPTLGKVLDVSYSGAGLADGRLLSFVFSRSDYRAFSVIGDTPVPHAHDFSAVEIDGKRELTDLGPFKKFRSHQMTRLSDGTLLASGYSAYEQADMPAEAREAMAREAIATTKDSKAPPEAPQHFTAVFLASKDEGKTWKYLSHIRNEDRFSYCEPAVLAGQDGRVITILRAQWHNRNQNLPSDVGLDGFFYGYYLYQSESTDSGKTWTKPQRLPLWGHPAHLTRLSNGHILMVFAQRRVPHAILGILSRDDGRTWDLRTLRTLHIFDPGSYDLGYPVATQLADGSILCAYYGYSTGNVGDKMPHGIFASIFDEEFLADQKGK